MSVPGRVQFADATRAAFALVPVLAPITVVATERGVDVTKAIAVIRMKSVKRNPQAPRTHRDMGLLLTIVSPREDLDAAADELEAWADAALDWLDTLSNVHHDGAEMVAYGDRLAVEITLTVLAAKD